MGKIVAGLASSHAFALSNPSVWDRNRERNRATYKSRYGINPPIHPQIAEETLEVRQARYQNIREGLDFLRDQLRSKRPDALILVGDDQNEHFKEDNAPQIAIYLGAEVFATERGDDGRRRGPRYSCHSDLAQELLNGLVEREFDLSFCKSFPNSELIAHAFSPILTRIVPDADIPIVPLFVNALHVPAPSPGRCYRLGRAIREIIEQRPAGERVAVYASGGLSYFTSGYPYRHYKGPHTYGSISEEFDRKALTLMEQGKWGNARGIDIGRSSCKRGHRDKELDRASRRSEWSACPSARHSGIMGMGVAYWELEE